MYFFLYLTFNVSPIFQYALPLSAAVFRGPKQAVPSCPPRLDVQTLTDGCWARVPEQMLSIHSLKLSGVRGWSMLCDHPGNFYTTANILQLYYIVGMSLLLSLVLSVCQHNGFYPIFCDLVVGSFCL